MIFVHPGNDASPAPRSVVAVTYSAPETALAADLWSSFDPGSPNQAGAGFVSFPYRITLPTGDEPASVTVQWAMNDSLGSLGPCPQVDTIESGLHFNDLPQALRGALTAPTGGTGVPGSTGVGVVTVSQQQTYTLISITDSQGRNASVDVFGTEVAGNQFASTIRCPITRNEAWTPTLSESQYVAPAATFAIPGPKVDTYTSSLTSLAPDSNYFYSRGTLEPRVDGLGGQSWQATGTSSSATSEMTYEVIPPYLIRLSSDGDTNRQQLTYLGLGAIGGLVASILAGALKWAGRALVLSRRSRRVGDGSVASTPFESRSTRDDFH